jgi:hypothetical protein
MELFEHLGDMSVEAKRPAVVRHGASDQPPRVLLVCRDLQRYRAGH